MSVVVPRWFLVWYNSMNGTTGVAKVVVPRWFLVWYNPFCTFSHQIMCCSSPVVLGMV